MKGPDRRWLWAIPIILSLLVISCAHSSLGTGSDLQLLRDGAVELTIQKLSSPSPEVIQVQWALTNTTQEPLEFCYFDGGVSFWTKDPETGQIRPIMLHAHVHGYECFRRSRLEPGESYGATEEHATNQTVHCNLQLVAALRVHSIPEHRGRHNSTLSLRSLPTSLEGCTVD